MSSSGSKYFLFKVQIRCRVLNPYKYSHIFYLPARDQFLVASGALHRREVRTPTQRVIRDRVSKTVPCLNSVFLGKQYVKLLLKSKSKGRRRSTSVAKYMPAHYLSLNNCQMFWRILKIFKFKNRSYYRDCNKLSKLC